MNRLVPLFITVLATVTTMRAQQDTAAYRAASAIVNSIEKTQALESFVAEFPASKLNTRASDALFDLYLEQNNEAGAVKAATRSLESLAPENRMSPYNRFAYSLALGNTGLDSALVWILRAEEMAQRTSPRSLPGFQDTRAYVLYRKGRFAEAEDLQRVALRSNESDPEMLSHLALFEQANGKTRDALKTMSRALYLGADLESQQRFLEWIPLAEKDASQQRELRKSVVMGTVQSFLDTLKGDKLVAARSHAAAFMAGLDVDLPLARTWTEAAVKTLDKNSSLNDMISFKQDIAIVLAAQKKFPEALVHLKAIEQLVDPYDAKYWLALGKSYENVADTRNAMESYMNGLVARNEPSLRSEFERTYMALNGSLNGIDSSLDSLKQESSNIKPGHFGKNTMPSGKVILAELFTGAECGPCVSSDMAFDALSEYYPRTAVAILEYHVHVPGPDPMTTNDSWERYKWYEGQGTPTVVIEGKESMIGGGSKYVARNRFGVYRYAIQKFENDKPLVNLAVGVKETGESSLTVTVDVTRVRKFGSNAKPALHVALVERSVDYTGANGVSKHLYVVRKMVDGAMGLQLPLKQSRASFTKHIHISEIEKTIKEYLDNPTTQPSWSTRRAFTVWRARPETLNRSNLAVVVWVQDMESKEVYQSAYEEVPTLLGMK